YIHLSHNLTFYITIHIDYSNHLFTFITLLTHLYHHTHLHSFPTRRSSDLLSHTAALRRNCSRVEAVAPVADEHLDALVGELCIQDRKSTRLNSSHQIISYAVFCL